MPNDITRSALAGHGRNSASAVHHRTVKGMTEDVRWRRSPMMTHADMQNSAHLHQSKDFTEKLLPQGKGDPSREGYSLRAVRTPCVAKRRVDLWAGGVARRAHSSSLEEEEDGPRATTRLPAGRMRAALESMREFSRHMAAATWRTKRLLRWRTSQPSPPLALASLSSDL
eukprot:scaffold5981_cov141-Isochrysis_galbana.AAC.10